MGRETLPLFLNISVSVSRHNNLADIADDALAEELKNRIIELLNEGKYDVIQPHWT